MNVRAELEDDNRPNASAYLDCNNCTFDDEQKRQVNCAWLDESNRVGRAVVPAGYTGEHPDICPGYLVQLPQVIDAVRAYSWRKDGALREYFGTSQITDLSRTAIDIVGGEFKAVEQYRIRKSREG